MKPYSHFYACLELKRLVTRYRYLSERKTVVASVAEKTEEHGVPTKLPEAILFTR